MVLTNGSLCGTTFNGTYVDATSLEREKYNITGDKAEVFITEILKRYKFPVFENEKFMTENCVWLKMAEDGYKIRWFNEPIYICEYLEGGLSDLNKKGLLKNFYGDIYTGKLYNDLYNYKLPLRIRNYGYYYDRCKAEKDKLNFLKTTFNVNSITLKLSYLVYKLYKIFFKK